MTPAQIMLFYLTKKTAAVSLGQMINPLTLGALTGGSAYAGSRWAGQLMKATLDLSRSIGYRGDFSHMATDQKKSGSAARGVRRSKAKNRP
jgi:hypothetical protein